MNLYLYRRMNRELRRMRFRAVGSGLLIVFAVAVYIAMAAMVPSSYDTLERKVEDLNLNDFMVRVNAGGPANLAELEGIEGMDLVEQRLVISSRMRYASGSEQEMLPAVFIGIDPTRPPEVNILEFRDGDGHYFDGNGSGQALVDKGFADLRGLRVGDMVSVLTDAGYQELTIVGLAGSAEYFFMPINLQSVVPVPGTLGVVYLPMDLLRSWFSLPPGLVNEFTMSFDKGTDPATVEAAVQEALSNDTILFTVEKDQVYGYALIRADLSQGDVFTGVIAAIILLVAFFVIYAAFARMVTEQRREIGVIRALGYSRRSVLSSYLYMAALLGGLSSLAGIALGLPLASAFANFYAEEAIRTEALAFILPPEAIVAGLLFGPITAALASAMAVWSTVSTEPQEAIRGIYSRKAARRGGRRSKARRFSPMSLYALRNLGRRKGRTALMVMAVSFSVVMGSMTFLMVGSFMNSIEATVKQGEHWDLVVDFSYPLDEDEVSALPLSNTSDHVPVAKLSVEWSSDGKGGTAVAIGMPADQALHEYSLYRGRVARASGEVMASYLMAKDEGVVVGDILHLGADLGSKDMEVVGVVEDMGGELYLLTEDLVQLIGKPVYSGMYVKAQGGMAEQVKDALLASPLVANVMGKDDVSSGYSELMANYQDLLYLWGLMSVGIAALAIANIIYVGIMERQGEYGQLRALGYRKADVARTVVIEVVIVIALGSLVALPLVLGVLEAMVDTFKAFWPMYSTILYPADWLDYLGIVGLTMAMGLLACVPAVRYLARLDVAKTVSGGRFG